MRLISINQCQKGMRLAKAIINEKGQVLIQEGIELTPRMITRLHELEISIVYIEDERTEDIVISEVLSEEKRRKALKTIKEEFSLIMSQKKIGNMIDAPNLGRSFRNVVKDILEDVQSHKQVISVLIDVKSFDQYIYQHSINVTIYTLALAMNFNYTEKQLMEIGLGAIMHDVGKMTIPLDILAKPSELSDEEFVLIQQHTTNGYNFLRSIHDIPLLSAHCAFQHHERLDGSGYPRGLKEKEIHEYAQIIAIADVFDALTSQRSYRKAMLPHMAMELIYSGAGTQFDYDLVTQFRKTISMYPLGITVKLSNGYKGIVVDHNKQWSSRPVIRLIEDKVGNPIHDVQEIDLSKHLAVVIEDCDLVL